MRACFVSFSLLIVNPAVALALPAATAVSVPQPESASIETNERPSDYLHVARSALVLGRIKAAQEALEMAQTRLLDRSVPLGQTLNPSGNPTSDQIFQARQALSTGDRSTCMRLIDTAISSATAQGL